MEKKIEDEINDLEGAIEGVVCSKSSSCHNQKRVAWRVFWGIMFLLGAAAAILGAMGVITLGMNIGWILLGILLIAIAIASLVKLNWFCFFMPIAGILTILVAKTDYLPVAFNDHIGTIWIVAVLVSIGFSILFHRKHHVFKHKISGKKVGRDNENVVEVSSHFGEVIKYIDSDKLQRVNINCAFSGAKLYFDNAKLDKGGAVIDLDLNFSGIELYIPRDWTVIDDSKNTFGGVNEKNSHRGGKSSSILTLTGNVTFSGIEIIYI